MNFFRSLGKNIHMEKEGGGGGGKKHDSAASLASSTKDSMASVCIVVKLAFHNKNLKPFFEASPGTPSPTATAPSTGSPRSSFLFKRTRINRRTVAEQIAMTAVAQLTLIATTFHFWSAW